MQIDIDKLEINQKHWNITLSSWGVRYTVVEPLDGDPKGESNLQQK